MAQQENPDGFPSHAGNQFSFDGFFGHQAYRPTGAAFRRAAAHHCNQTLFLAMVQHFRRSRPRLLIQRLFQAALPITVADVSNALGRQWNNAGNSRRTYAFCQLQERQSTQHHSDLLDSAAHQLSEFLLILDRHFNTQGRASHTLVCIKTFSIGIVLLTNLQAVTDLVLDSGVLIAAERDARPVSGLLAVLEHDHGENEIGLSAITVIELEHGLHRAQTEEQVRNRRNYLDTVYAAIPVEPFTRDMAQIAAKIDAEARKSGCVIPFSDLLIGATALRFGYGVGTRNLRHFQMIPGLTLVSRSCLAL